MEQAWSVSGSFAGGSATRKLARGPDGAVETWTAETNSPSILVRRGWSKDTLKPGDKVTVKGWPARNGARYLRMQNAYWADGRMIGKLFDPNAD